MPVSISLWLFVNHREILNPPAVILRTYGTKNRRVEWSTISAFTTESAPLITESAPLTTTLTTDKPLPTTSDYCAGKFALYPTAGECQYKHFALGNIRSRRII